MTTPDRKPYRASASAGGWIAISGQFGLKDGVIVDGGLGPEMAQALVNLKAVVEEAGATLDDIVKTNVYLLDTFPSVEASVEYKKVFTMENPPARTAHAVPALPNNARVMIEAWAYKPTA